MSKTKNKIPAQTRLHVIVSGIVQGVNFRHYAAQEAQRLGLAGWVANRWDGTVEVVAEGPRPALLALLDWLGHGPPSAHVDGVQSTWEDATGEWSSFRVRYL